MTRTAERVSHEVAKFGSGFSAMQLQPRCRAIASLLWRRTPEGNFQSRLIETISRPSYEPYKSNTTSQITAKCGTKEFRVCPEAEAEMAFRR